MDKVKVFITLSAIIAVIIIVFWDALANLDVNKYQLFSYEYEHTRSVAKSPKKPGKPKHHHIKQIFKRRTEKVRKVCSENESKIPLEVGINNLIWSIEAKHKLLMCRTAKHGSTTWSNYFVQIYTKG